MSLSKAITTLPEKPKILRLERLSQEDFKFEARLGYLFKKKKKDMIFFTTEVNVGLI